MKITVQSQEKFLKEQFIKETIQKDSEGYSSILDYPKDELVKLNMRKIASEYDESWYKPDLLSESIALTISTLNQEGKRYNLDRDFSDYFKEAPEDLEFVANEISSLRDKLFKSKKEERIGRKEEIISRIDHQLSFDVIEIGLKESIEGLISIPQRESFEMDIEQTKNNYNMTGDWFPFEIQIDYFTFILDDDGTIFVSTDNLPEDLIKRSRELLEELANKIYTNVSNYV